MRNLLRTAPILALTCVLLGLTIPAQARTAPLPAPGPAAPGPSPGAISPNPSPDPSTVPPDQRDRVLPANWRTSADLAWTTSGDATGFHLLVAEARTGYTWRTAATLSEPGIQSDQWVGNACLTASGKRAVVVYAPRHFTNRQNLFGRGAFAAVVELATGKVTKLGVGVTLAYYNPGCGAGETVALTQSGAADLGKTRLHLLDATTGRLVRRHELAGQATSAVPLGERIAAAEGGRLVALDAAGRKQTLARTRGVAFDVRPDAHGGLAFLELRDTATSRIRYLDAGGAVRELGHGPLSEVALAAGSGGRVFVTGSPASLVTGLPAGMRRVAAPTDAQVSTLGQVAVTHARPSAADRRAQPREPGLARPVRLEATVLSGGQRLSFQARPGSRAPELAVQGRAPNPMLRATRLAGVGKPDGKADGESGIQGVGSPTDPVDDDRTCAVSRNDVRAQIVQPHWRQVEWAANLAVQGALTIQRPANWPKQSGLPAWSPQGMYPPVVLAGSGGSTRIPAQVLLGILAQESNLWQASWHALEGVAGNPLVGSYYGNRDAWTIDWANADCGYGVAQITDGMRRGSPERTPTQQLAIALDYATNIAAGMRILGQKWNQMQAAEITVNDNNPQRIENWFAAVWAYNSGVNPQAITGNTTGCTPSPSCTDDRGNWGLGWGNNPANPDYPYNRKPFLNGSNGEGSPHDAAHPQDWPYPEKVMGWAAYPIIKSDFRDEGFFEPGYLQAWWTTNVYRTAAIKPPLDTFCSSLDNCSINAEGRGSCGWWDFHCWWHWPVDWRSGCTDTDPLGNPVIACGFDNIRFSPGDAEPPNGTHYPAVCSTTGLPPGALIVDDQPDSVLSLRPCATPTSNNGSFGLVFQGAPNGTYPSKKDFHQIGAGLDGHFWFAHTYTQDLANAHHMKVTGTWTLDRSWTNVWARVLVHLPGHGAHTQQAAYVVDRGANAPAATRFKTRAVNTKSRYIDPNNRGDRWVSLGVFQFNGVPKVSLSNISKDADGNGVHDIAFDAVAFQPLPAKPRHFVVAMGDSYSSGEGASENFLTDYYRETDSDGGNEAFKNACHRSPHAWPRRATLADNPGVTIGARADTWDTTLDYHMVACSGAQTENILPSGVSNAFGDPGGKPAHGELSQIEAGYLDENTTLVTISIGGNDGLWSRALAACLLFPINDPCQEHPLPNNPLPGEPVIPMEDYFPLLINGKVRDSIRTALEQIHLKAPNARIVLMGYPQLFSFGQWCFFNTISISEGSWMNHVADLFATMEQDLAAELRADGHPVWSSDPRAGFQNKGVCGIPEAIHGLVIGTTPGESPGTIPSQQSFHPKILGAGLYANTLTTTLRSLGL